MIKNHGTRHNTCCTRTLVEIAYFAVNSCELGSTIAKANVDQLVVGGEMRGYATQHIHGSRIELASKGCLVPESEIAGRDRLSTFKSIQGSQKQAYHLVFCWHSVKTRPRALFLDLMVGASAV